MLKKVSIANSEWRFFNLLSFPKFTIHTTQSKKKHMQILSELSIGIGLLSLFAFGICWMLEIPTKLTKSKKKL
jgi:hypothetical protein